MRWSALMLVCSIRLTSMFVERNVEFNGDTRGGLMRLPLDAVVRVKVCMAHELFVQKSTKYCHVGL